jgi:fused signal recognition particle receptor
MPSGVGLELVVVGVLLAILFAAGTVALVRRTYESRAELPPNDSLKELVATRFRPGRDPRDLIEDVARTFEGDASLSLTGRPAVVMVVGGTKSGRTTMVGKLGHRLVNRGRLVAMTALDTFRLAAVRQLAPWAERAGADLIALEGTTDAGAAAHEAVDTARTRGSDVLLVDTAGDTAADEETMDELARVRRVLQKAAAHAPEVLLVLDASARSSAITGAEQLVEAVGATGIAVSNLDRGGEPGFILAAREKLGIPVKLVGTGENIEDLRSFDTSWFAGIVAAMEGEVGMPLTDDSLPAASERPPSAAGS